MATFMQLKRIKEFIKLDYVTGYVFILIHNGKNWKMNLEQFYDYWWIDILENKEKRKMNTL